MDKKDLIVPGIIFWFFSAFSGAVFIESQGILLSEPLMEAICENITNGHFPIHKNRPGYHKTIDCLSEDSSIIFGSEYDLEIMRDNIRTKKVMYAVLHPS